MAILEDGFSVQENCAQSYSVTGASTSDETNNEAAIVEGSSGATGALVDPVQFGSAKPNSGQSVTQTTTAEKQAKDYVDAPTVSGIVMPTGSVLDAMQFRSESKATGATGTTQTDTAPKVKQYWG